MLRARWNGVVLAETPRTVRVEGNHYFPPESLRREHMQHTSTRTLCPWKGVARYYTAVADGETHPDAAWYYPRPSPLARKIRDHVAFGPAVLVEGEPEPASSESGNSPAGGDDRPPVWRSGLLAGLVGISCCVGPTMLALLGVVSAGTAFAWATDLYDGYAWWFRLGGVLGLGLLVWLSLRRRDQCNLAGVRRWRWRLLGVLGVAVCTYLTLYALTTWLGTFA